MDNKLFLLTKVLLKNGTNPTGKGKKNRSQLLLIAIIALAFTPMVIEIVKFLADTYDALFAFRHQQGVMLSLGLTIIAFVIFFFGIFYVLNTFYFSNDIESLLPLPFKPGDILGAKFIVTAVYEYLTELIFILPILIVYGVKSNANVMYWAYSLIIFFILPIIPLMLSSLIIMPIMRFTAFAKNKDRFRFVSSLFIIVVALGLNFGIQKFAAKSVTQGDLQNLFIQGNNSLIGVISRFFPSSKLATESLINAASVKGLLYLVLFIVLSVLAFVIFQYLGEFLYFKGVMGVSESSSKRKKLTKEELTKSTVKSSVVRSYTIKEIRLLFRTPSYFLNCVLMNFLYPLFLIFPFLAQSSNSNKGVGQLVKYINEKSYAGYVLVIAFAIITFITASNGLTSTSISREGQTIYINKYLPVSYIEQILAKVFSGFFVSFLGLLSLIVISEILFKIGVLIALGVFLTGIIAILFTSFTGILIDIYNPKLIWDNEQKAVKQNLNLIFTMLLCTAAAGLTIFGVFFFSFNFIETFFGIIIVFGLIDILLYYLLSTVGVRRFSKIEI